MKAALISLGSKSSIMTADAMKKYFNEVDMIQLRDIEVNLGKEGGILYQGEPMKDYDCVFLKGSFRYANILRSIASMLEGKVAYMPIPADAFSTVHNKLLSHLKMQQDNIPMPRTYVSSTIEAAKELLKRVSYPIVMKFPEGTQGKGVMFADSVSSAVSLLDALVALNQPVIIQQYVETGGTDIRAIVVGDKVVASYKRRAQKEDKRSNIHSGGSGESVQLSWQAAKIAVQTAKSLGVDMCGVDILESPLGPVVIEANLSPGLQGISQISTVDIPDAMARFMFEQTKKIVDKKRNVGAAEVLRDISLNQPKKKEGNGHAIISPLKLRGDRIILPEFVNKMAKFSEAKEYSIKASKGSVIIEEFDM
jgi:ribosomal protein S6--L-glutamate ligase